MTPYQFASNRPIDGIDLDGLEFAPAIGNPDPHATESQRDNLPPLNVQLIRDANSTGATLSSNDNKPNVAQEVLEKAKVKKVEYTDSDEEVNVASDSQPAESKITLNAGINLWNGTVDLLQHPVDNTSAFVSAVGNLPLTLLDLGSGVNLTGSYTYATFAQRDQVLGVGLGLATGKLGLATGRRINPFGFRNGFGVFGEKGLEIGSFKIEAMYATPSIAGTGTIFSVYQPFTGGSKFRLDYGLIHKSGGKIGFHSMIRFKYNGTVYGSNAQRYPLPTSYYPPFFEVIKK